MNLHENTDAFRELTAAASVELQIPAPIIEKDYYVTLVLKELSLRIPEMVFKGGTSLTKCFHLINRFSEDLDISYAASCGTPGRSRKRHLKGAVLEAIDTLHLTITNLQETKSRRNYNCYRANYSSLYNSVLGIQPELIIETYIALLPFPTETRFADNYIHIFLQQIGQEDLAAEFRLMPFPVTVQTIERTLIDKIFAICDYYLLGKTERHSRHLYDIYCITRSVPLTDSFSSLVREVRAVRAPLPNCPSAGRDVSIPEILREIITKNVYREDYKSITEPLLFVPLSYENAVSSLQTFLDSHHFN